MPYEWLSQVGGTQRLHLWPHRSLTQRGFVWFIGLTSLLIATPLLFTFGSPVLWAMLPFLVGAIWAIWFALRKNGLDRDILEELILTRDRVTLARHGPNGKRQDWQANPYWVRVSVHATGGPVPQYLTLMGEGREVELGVFLSEDERAALHDDLRARLSALRSQIRN